MTALVGSEGPTIDVMDAGTTMRFLTAYFSVTNQQKVMTGTDRMKERPIGPLVNALRTLGVRIDYKAKDGFPPFEILGFDRQLTREVTVPGHLSSQYISALMMIGPALPNGLVLHLEGKVGSKPYIQMTASIMRAFGARTVWTGPTIEVAPGGYKPIPYRIEADWSAISYWYGFTALSDEARIELKDVTVPSLQGDQVIANIGEPLGVKTTRSGEGLVLTKIESAKHLEWNFTDCPDLAQTVLPVCAAKGITGAFTGLESLRIKETDRISALQNELAKIGAALTEREGSHWALTPAAVPLNRQGTVKIQTYHDHRMAMGFAPWATQTPLDIEDREVVNKSYPGFWEDMKAVGFTL